VASTLISLNLLGFSDSEKTGRKSGLGPRWGHAAVIERPQGELAERLCRPDASLAAGSPLPLLGLQASPVPPRRCRREHGLSALAGAGQRFTANSEPVPIGAPAPSGPCPRSPRFDSFREPRKRSGHVAPPISGLSPAARACRSSALMRGCVRRSRRHVDRAGRRCRLHAL
jgi:hypothetical protein